MHEKTILAEPDTCAGCNVELRLIRDEISEKLEYIPAHLAINTYVRHQLGRSNRPFAGSLAAGARAV